MSFKFSVTRAREISSTHLYLLEGRLLEGTLRAGSQGVVTAMPGVSITVESIAIVCASQPDVGEITIGIRRPNAELRTLEGQTIQGG
jgi:hypothetical protein